MEHLFFSTVIVFFVLCGASLSMLVLAGMFFAKRYAIVTSGIKRYYRRIDCVSRIGYGCAIHCCSKDLLYG